MRTPALERALRSVPRQAFLPAPFALAIDDLATEIAETDDPRRLYTDVMVVLLRAPSVLCSAPSVVAAQIERLAPGDGMRVLHIGTGSGYCTALLAELVGERGTVVGVEHDPEVEQLGAALLAQAGYTTVTVRAGDGALGVPEAAPFDRIS